MNDAMPSFASNMLLGPYLALQQAQQLESAERYLQRLEHLALCDERSTGSAINDNSCWKEADLPAVVLCYRLRVSDKPVLEQLTRLLETIAQWSGPQNVCASSARLLGLWLDKCLRRDVVQASSQAHKLKIMSLSTFEARCLGRLVSDVTDWLKAHNAGGSTDIERLSGMNSVLQALSAFRQSSDFAQGVEWLMSHGFGDEMAVLLYGALAGCFYPMDVLSNCSDSKME
jgi:hypothetical protein